ncbi:MAG: CDGSH iron-sulfur domain-containing protein [Longimicrobiales bacterium]
MPDTPSDVKIIVNRNASLKVEGDVPLVDHEGNVIETPEGRYFLCRCGESSRKPFCDGTHKRCDFDGTLAERG